MMWIALHIHFGFECIIGEDLSWVCDKAGISKTLVLDKNVEGRKIEVWNGDKLWVVEQVDPNRLQFVINGHLERRKSKFS